MSVLHKLVWGVRGLPLFIPLVILPLILLLLIGAVYWWRTHPSGRRRICQRCKRNKTYPEISEMGGGRFMNCLTPDELKTLKNWVPMKCGHCGWLEVPDVALRAEGFSPEEVVSATLVKSP